MDSNPYFVHEILSGFKVNQLRQLAKEFQIKAPAKATHSQLVGLLVNRNRQIGGAKETKAQRQARLTTEKQRRIRLARLKRVDPDSYYREICGTYGLIEDEEELAEAKEEGAIPYKDVITRMAIDPKDIYILNKRCYSKKAMKSWAKSRLERGHKPTDPLTGNTLTDNDIKRLGLKAFVKAKQIARRQARLRQQQDAERRRQRQIQQEREIRRDPWARFEEEEEKEEKVGQM